MKRWEVWYVGLRAGWCVKECRWRWQARLNAWERNLGTSINGREPYEVRERTR